MFNLLKRRAQKRLDLAAMPPIENSTAAKLVEQTLELFAKPEIERRMADGRVTPDFTLTAIQVLLQIGEESEIRLNEEVRAKAIVRAQRKVEKGGEVYAADLRGLQGMQLTEADPDAGHITMLFNGEGWSLAFDFRYNRTRARQHVTVATEYLDAARRDVRARSPRPALENLHSAVELLAKARLLLLPFEGILKSRSHKHVRSEFNKLGKWGTAPDDQVRLLNQLADLRGSARYLEGEVALDLDQVKEMLRNAEAMHKHLSDHLPVEF